MSTSPPTESHSKSAGRVRASDGSRLSRSSANEALPRGRDSSSSASPVPRSSSKKSRDPSRDKSLRPKQLDKPTILFESADNETISAATREGLLEHFAKTTSETNPSEDGSWYPIISDCGSISSQADPTFQLLTHLLSLASSGKLFVEQVIVSYRYFTPLHDLLEIILKTFAPNCPASTSAGCESLTPSPPHSDFINVQLKLTVAFDRPVFWALRTLLQYEKGAIKAYSKCTDLLNKFLGELQGGSTHHQGYAGFLKRSLEHDDHVDYTTRRVAATSAKITSAEGFPALDILAQQIALVDSHYFSQVKLVDFYGAAWMKQTEKENGIVGWIEHSNRFSRWIAFKILSETKKENRVKILGKFIKLIDVLRGIRCFSGMMNVYLSLQIFPLSRLKRTCKAVPRALNNEYKRFEALLRPMNNFSGYREMIANAATPCTPYIGVVTKDIVALEEMPSQDEDDPTFLNWFKVTQISKALLPVLRMQRASFSFETHPDLFYELVHPDAAGQLPSNEALVQLSEQVEPDEREIASPAHTRPLLNQQHRTHSATSNAPPEHIVPCKDYLQIAMCDMATALKALHQRGKSPDTVTCLIEALSTIAGIITGTDADCVTSTTPLAPLLRHVEIIFAEMVSKKGCTIKFEADQFQNAQVNGTSLVSTLLVLLNAARADLGTEPASVTAVLNATRVPGKTLLIATVFSQPETFSRMSIPLPSTSAVRVASKQLGETTIPFSPVFGYTEGNAGPATVVLTFTLPTAVAVVDNAEVLARLATKQVSKWTVRDVCQWLVAKLNLEPRLSAAFSKNEVSGQVLYELGMSDLTEMGLDTSNAKIILAAVQALQSQEEKPKGSIEAPPIKTTPPSRPKNFICAVVGPGGERATISLPSDPSKTSWESLSEILRSACGLGSSRGGDDSTPAGQVVKLQYIDSESDSMDISDESGFARARGYIFEDLALGFQWSKFQVQLAKVQPRFAVEKFEHLDEATFVTYGDHAFIKYVNRAALQLLGLADITINEAPIEAVLVQPFDFYRSLHATGALPTPTVVLSANGPLSVILNLVPENGHWVWTLTTIDCSEDPSANQSTIVSLSSLRERLASSAQPSMILSGEGIVSFNRAASDLLGFDLHAVYRKKLDMLAPTHTRELAALLAEAESKRGQECELPSILLQRRDGSLLVCSVVVREWENSEGSPARFFSAVVKITEN